MSNDFLNQSGNNIIPVKYRTLIARNMQGKFTAIKLDIESTKFSFTGNFLSQLMNTNHLKLIDYKLIIYIIHNLKKDKGEVTLNPTIIEKHIQRKKSTISASINRLIKEGYIARIKTYQYHINPLLYFKGNRIEYIGSIDQTLIKEVE